MRTLAPLVLLLATCTDPPPVDDAIATPALHTPRWAFRTWISKDISDGADTRAFVKGFQERQIPVGVVVLDSPWETHYNTFVPNPKRYPEFPKLVADLRADGIRTVLWVTSLVNEVSFDLEPGGDTYAGASPNLQAGLDDGYFINGGARYFWWKGTGAAVDFFNPAAVKWWHAQQDAVLDTGIAGWKLDFGEEYVEKFPCDTAAGPKTKQQYSEAYYRDFLAYGVHRRGPEEFLTMVRPWDESYGFPGRFFARKEHAPVAWVGDNRRDWVGLVDALDSIFRSAQAGYLVVGSDIGGYLDRNDRDLNEKIPADTSVFLRWTALGALTPFMQLHGRANLTPWTVPDRVEETVAAWKFWSTLHEDLGPFFYSLSEEGIAGGGTIIRPVGDPASWAGDWRFQLGEAFLVAPIFDATGVRDVTLPAGARWFDWWKPAETALEGGTRIAAYDVADAARIPLFVREGAIVPMASALRVWPGPVKSAFRWHEDDGVTTVVEASGATITLSRVGRPITIGVRRDAATTGVTAAGAALTAVSSLESLGVAASGFFDDRSERVVWIRLPASGPVSIVTVP